MASSSAALIDTGDFEAVTEAELVAEAPDDREANENVSDALPVIAAEPVVAPERHASAESGARPSPAVLAARIEAALSASARNEATLSDLLRTAKFLSASINSVRDANAALVRELEELCSMVDGEGAERGTLERRIQRLERLVDETGRDAARERKFLVEEHDAFIASLVNDHERELAALRRRLAELESQPSTPPSDDSTPERA
ncbi:MAG: hypothetical protein ACOY0T_08035 [Myxococcota bacterium]